MSEQKVLLIISSILLIYWSVYFYLTVRKP